MYDLEVMADFVREAAKTIPQRRARAKELANTLMEQLEGEDPTVAEWACEEVARRMFRRGLSETGKKLEALKLNRKS